MLELIIIIVLLLFSFLSVAWYARLRSQRRSRAFELKTRITVPPVDNQFGRYLNEQLAKQQQPVLGDVDEAAMQNQFTEEPGVTLSSSGVLAAEEHLDAQSKLMEEGGVSAQVKLGLTESDEPYVANMSDEQSASAKHNVKVSSKSIPKKKEWDIILALTIVAYEGHLFSGHDIATALKSVDMEAGEMDVFHRHVPGQRGQTLFSVANLLAPGTLKPTALPTLETQGLMVFMRLPSPTNGLLVFDAMLEATDKISKHLNGQLRDEHRQKLTEATLEKMRSRILNFNLAQQLDNHQFKHDYSN